MRRLIIVLIVVGLGLTACSVTRQKLSPQGNVDFKTAQVYYSQENVEKAEVYYNRVLTDKPDHAISLRRLADIKRFNSERFVDQAVVLNKEAFELYTKAIQITEAYDKITDEERLAIRDMKKNKEGSWVRIYKRAEAVQAEGNTQEAMQIFEIALQLDPSRPQPKIKLKDIYMDELKNPAKAEEILLSLHKDYPNELPYILELGAFYYNEKDYVKAVTYFEKVREKAPSDIDNLLNLSFSYFETENFTKALEATQLAMELDPSNLEPVVNAKDIAMVLKDNDLAISYLKRLIERRNDKQDYQDICVLLNAKADYAALITYAEKWYNWDSTSMYAVQFIILGAQQTKNIALETKYNNIYKNMQ